MTITKFLYGETKENDKVYGYHVENEFLRVTIIEYGAIITALQIKKKDNRDIVLGYDDLRSYEDDSYYFGATIGRCANRIAKGQFLWQGTVRQLEINNGENHLHGGKFGCHAKVWQSFCEDGVLYLRTFLREEDDGYPANVEIILGIHLEENKLKLSYAYRSDEDSFVNITNHAYFCLNEDDTVEKHSISLDADEYTPFTKTQIPTGDILTVQDTPFDLRSSTCVGSALMSNANILEESRGYDHNFLRATKEDIGRCAKICADGICLEIFSDAPAFQFYTGNWVDGVQGKYGKVYHSHCGLCIEPQFVPNAINMPQFKTPVIKKNIAYERNIVYKISCK